MKGLSKKEQEFQTGIRTLFIILLLCFLGNKMRAQSIGRINKKDGNIYTTDTIKQRFVSLGISYYDGIIWHQLFTDNKGDTVYLTDKGKRQKKTILKTIN